MVDEMERIGTSTEKTFLPSSPLSPFPAFETFIVNSKGKDVSSLYRAASEVAWPNGYSADIISQLVCVLHAL